MRIGIYWNQGVANEWRNEPLMASYLNRHMFTAAAIIHIPI